MSSRHRCSVLRHGLLWLRMLAMRIGPLFGALAGHLPEPTAYQQALSNRGTFSRTEARSGIRIMGHQYGSLPGEVLYILNFIAIKAPSQSTR